MDDRFWQYLDRMNADFVNACLTICFLAFCYMIYKIYDVAYMCKFMIAEKMYDTPIWLRER